MFRKWPVWTAHSKEIPP